MPLAADLREHLREHGAAVLGAAGLAAGGAILLARLTQGRPYSYPGDAVPKEKQLGRRAQFRGGAKRTVEPGWRPQAEQQPPGDALPHRVAGQQVWVFDEAGASKGEVLAFDPASNPNAGDAVFREARLQRWKGRRPDGTRRCQDPLEAARKGFSFYQMLQCDDGQWAGDYGGPHFLLPGFVISAYITGMDGVLPRPAQRAIEVYLRNHQQADGGWGSHLESPSTLFGSVLNYVALRLVGVPPSDPACVEGRRFLRQHGGALFAPSWAKFWLCVLGVYDYRGIAPVPPEMWLLPAWFPLHPGRFWCHCRMVYLPMCFLYGRRFVYPAASEDPVTLSLREELYAVDERYSDIRWGNFLHTIADVDNYSPIHWAMRLLQNALAAYEAIGAWAWPRRASLQFAEEYIASEDLETNYLTIGPVSKALHVVCAWVMAGGEADAASARESRAFRAHVERIPAYLWVAEDGMKAQGYNGSMMWDTSFAVQAVAEAGLQGEFADMSKRAFEFICREQVRALPRGDWRHWRQPIRGGWGFSTAEQAWPVSDTTAEAFKAVLALRKDGCTKGSNDMPDQHYFDTVQFLLSYQNADGGWATYENCRGWKWYEALNPSEVFGEIMIDYSYVECSASSMSALAEFSKQFPDHRRQEIQRAIRRGRDFIKAIQRDDGSWYGCWGNCFTYGCWFGVEGLLAAGEPPRCEPIRRCVRFLLQRQEPDGGWGEDFLSCFNREYTTCDRLYGCDSGSSVVCTAWALLALMAGECDDTDAVRRGVDFLMRRQLPTGDWAQENIAGVFNRSIGISYTSFRNVYPLWALGRFVRHYAPRHGLQQGER